MCAVPKNSYEPSDGGRPRGPPKPFRVGSRSLMRRHLLRHSSKVRETSADGRTDRQTDSESNGRAGQTSHTHTSRTGFGSAGEEFFVFAARAGRGNVWTAGRANGSRRGREKYAGKARNRRPGDAHARPPRRLHVRSGARRRYDPLRRAGRPAPAYQRGGVAARSVLCTAVRATTLRPDIATTQLRSRTRACSPIPRTGRRRHTWFPLHALVALAIYTVYLIITRDDRYPYVFGEEKKFSALSNFFL